jgi:hypothetical protein
MPKSTSALFSGGFPGRAHCGHDELIAAGGTYARLFALQAKAHLLGS